MAMGWDTSAIIVSKKPQSCLTGDVEQMLLIMMVWVGRAGIGIYIVFVAINVLVMRDQYLHAKEMWMNEQGIQCDGGLLSVSLLKRLVLIVLIVLTVLRRTLEFPKITSSLRIPTRKLCDYLIRLALGLAALRVSTLRVSHHSMALRC